MRMVDGAMRRRLRKASDVWLGPSQKWLRKIRFWPLKSNVAPTQKRGAIDTLEASTGRRHRRLARPSALRDVANIVRSVNHPKKLTLRPVERRHSYTDTLTTDKRTYNDI